MTPLAQTVFKTLANAAYTELVEYRHLSFCLLFPIDEVRHAVSQLKYKAAGFHGATLEMIIYAGESIVYKLTCLFNSCLLCNCVPECFTKSIVVSVLKDKLGKLDSIENYRPISLVNMFSKVLELSIGNRLTPLFNVDGLQYGFVSDIGRLEALFTIESVVNYCNCLESVVNYCNCLESVVNYCKLS